MTGPTEKIKLLGGKAGVKKGRPSNSPPRKDNLSLHPLRVEDAIRAALQTGRYPKLKKKGKRSEN